MDEAKARRNSSKASDWEGPSGAENLERTRAGKADHIFFPQRGAGIHCVSRLREPEVCAEKSRIGPRWKAPKAALDVCREIASMARLASAGLRLRRPRRARRVNSAQSGGS